MEHTNTSDWYVADSYKNLETIGGIFEKDGKEYINVILKSGKVRAARVYRPALAPAANTKTKHLIYDIRKELGFAPSGFIYLVRHEDEEKLNGYCHFDPHFGAYLKCNENVLDLPLGCNIYRLNWVDITDDNFHLLAKEDILKIIKNMI